MKPGLSMLAGTLCATAALGGAVGPTQTTAWRSVRSHAGPTFSISLDPNQSVTGAPTVETRRGGIRRIEVDFSVPSIITPGAVKVAGIGHDAANLPLPPVSYTPASTSITNAGFTLVIEFADGQLPDGATYWIDLGGVATITNDSDCAIRSLVGDVVPSGSITDEDQAAIKAKNGATVTNATALFDTNLDGRINLTDVALAKTLLGKTVASGLAAGTCVANSDCPSGACTNFTCAATATDCVVSAWGPWSTCSTTCGSGTQTRTRTVVTPSSNGGAACPSLTETQACNTQPCPVDCVVSAWSSWSGCSATCGGGMQTRTRSIVTPAAFGGAACPVLTESQPCNTQPCPIDCVVSAWSPWSGCSATCGGGFQTRTRSIVTSPAFGGAACPTLSQTQACNTQPCAIDCVVSAWSTWSACSTECGGGSQIRTRSVVVAPAFGGAACPVLQDTQSCNTQPCMPITCQDGIQDGQESGPDCGGPCQPCATGFGCFQDGDCQTGICRSGVCVAPSCNDGLKNGGETDADCGGQSCRTCVANKSCAVSSDCASNICVGGVCIPCSSDGQCPSNTMCILGGCESVSCLDGIKDGLETDTDCGGGTCNRCGNGQSCSVNGDCASSKCIGGVCVP